MTPGVRRIAMAEYLALPAVSASVLCRIIDECPAAAWWSSWLNPNRPKVDDSTNETRLGSVAHAILLEDNAEIVQIIDAKDWRTAAAKEARAAAIAAGKIPLLPHQMPAITGMVAAARAFIESLRETEPAIWEAFQPKCGDSELTLVWDDNGVLCRARPDRMSADRRVFIDLKTGGTCAEPDTWGRTQLVRMGYYVGAAFYRRGAKAIFGHEPDYVYLVQEQEAPYLCSLVGVEPSGLHVGAAKVARGLARWKSCAAVNQWPGYPNRVAYVELPAWEVARAEERNGIPFDPAKLYPSRDELARSYESLPE